LPFGWQVSRAPDSSSNAPLVNLHGAMAADGYGDRKRR